MAKKFLIVLTEAEREALIQAARQQAPNTKPNSTLLKALQNLEEKAESKLTAKGLSYVLQAAANTLDYETETLEAFGSPQGARSAWLAERALFRLEAALRA
jgi:hypothetical protein